MDRRYDSLVESTEGTPHAVLCPDSFVRLSFDVLLKTKFVHLISGLDEEITQHTSDNAAASTIQGYTEWLSDSNPIITIGWDWALDSPQSPALCVRTCQPRSNIMLVGPNIVDLGFSGTELLLASAIDLMHWQKIVYREIGIRYQ